MNQDHRSDKAKYTRAYWENAANSHGMTLGEYLEKIGKTSPELADTLRELMESDPDKDKGTP